PPSGVALAALLLWGPRYWPGITIGAFLVNASSGVPLAGAAGLGAGNTLEAGAGVLLLRRVAGFGPRLAARRGEPALGLLAGSSAGRHCGSAREGPRPPPWSCAAWPSGTPSTASAPSSPRHQRTTWPCCKPLWGCSR